MPFAYDGQCTGFYLILRSKNAKCQSALTCVRAGDWEQHPIPPSPLTTGVAERLTRLCSLRPTILELANEGGSPCVFEAHIGVCQLQRGGTPHIGRSCVEWHGQATDVRIQRGRSRQRIGHPC